MKDFDSITINGQTYHSLEEVPAELREKYAEAFRAMQKMEARGESGASGHVELLSETFEYDGKTYRSREELPPEVREALAQLPEPDLKDAKPEVVIEQTKVLPDEVRVFEVGDWERRKAKSSGLIRFVVVALVLLAALLLILWLSGVKPSHLLPR